MSRTFSQKYSLRIRHSPVQPRLSPAFRKSNSPPCLRKKSRRQGGAPSGVLRARMLSQRVFALATNTMSKHLIQTKQAPAPLGAYSQGWRAGDFIFVTGTGPTAPASGDLFGRAVWTR